MDYKNITMKIPLLCVIVPVGLGGVVLVRSITHDIIYSPKRSKSCSWMKKNNNTS